MHRIVIVASLLFLFAQPAAAQDAPPGYAYGTTRVAEPPPSEPRGAFAPRDRLGRSLVGTRTETHNDRGLWGLGLGLLLPGYVLSIVGTAIFNAVSDDRDGALEEDAMAWSIVPIVGPIIQLGLSAPHPALPILSGLLQLSGTVLIALGITSEHETEVPIYAWGDPHDARTARIGLDVAPSEAGAVARLTLHTM